MRCAPRAEKLERQADEVLRPFREATDRLATMPGVSETVARVIIAEVGVDMTQFPSAGHLVSWAGLCPRPRRERGQAPLDPDSSRHPMVEDGAGSGLMGGEPKEGELSAGAVSTAQGSVRPEEGHRGGRASMLTAVYFMLRDEKDYHDLGGRYLAERDKERVTKNLLRRLQNPGVVVEVKAA